MWREVNKIREQHRRECRWTRRSCGAFGFDRRRCCNWIRRNCTFTMARARLLKLRMGCSQRCYISARRTNPYSGKDARDWSCTWISHFWRKARILLRLSFVCCATSLYWYILVWNERLGRLYAIYLFQRLLFEGYLRFARASILRVLVSWSRRLRLGSLPYFEFLKKARSGKLDYPP